MSRYVATSPIQLRKMPQLAEAVGRLDDWTGITDASLRRKRQNRLNVRAYRRKDLAHSTSTSTDATMGLRKVRKSHLVPTSASTIEPGIPCWIEDQQAVLHLPASVAKALSNTRTPLLPVMPTRTQFPRIIFPLSSDHLITLLQFNVLRGLLTNRQLLSRLLPNTASNDECSSAALHVLPDLDAFSLQSLPPSLHPTTLQNTTSHGDWIDNIPHSVFRDNLIHASGKFDEDELWSDVVGGLFQGFPASEIEQRGVVVWSPPWHASGWEVSEGFWRKWKWLLKGCGTILDATNLRRKERGQDPLEFEI